MNQEIQIKENNVKSIRFSNYWLMFGISLIPWILIFATFQWVSDDRNYESLRDINDDLDNFLWIMILGLIFTSMATTATSYFASVLPNFLDDLKPIIGEPKEEIEGQVQNPTGKTLNWYDNFRSNIAELTWVWFYFIPLSFLSLIIHYFVYGHLVVETFGWFVYMATIIAMLWSNIFVLSWLIWFIVGQYLHIYRFHDSKGIRYIGIDDKEKKFGYRILPTNVKPRKINVDVFNVDELGGLSPLASMNMMGAFLMGLVASVLVPLRIIVDLVFALILLPFIFLGIVFGYLIGIASIREAIRKEKTDLLGKINKELSLIANQIINNKAEPASGEYTNSETESKVELSTEKMAEHNKRFEILDQIGKRINAIPESPRSLSATIRVLSAGILPLISFVSINQVGIFV